MNPSALGNESSLAANHCHYHEDKHESSQELSNTMSNQGKNLHFIRIRSNLTIKNSLRQNNPQACPYKLRNQISQQSAHFHPLILQHKKPKCDWGIEVSTRKRAT